MPSEDDRWQQKVCQHTVEIFAAVKHLLNVFPHDALHVKKLVVDSLQSRLCRRGGAGRFALHKIVVRVCRCDGMHVSAQRSNQKQVQWCTSG
jgi:hypothetical protein